MGERLAIYQAEDGYWYNENDEPICARRRKQCPKTHGGCGHQYTKDEHDLWECPECGLDRHCQFPVKKAGEACRYHGGLTPRGVEHYAYKHGLYSKHLPGNLLADYQAFKDDPNRLSLEEEMALIRSMVAERARALNAVHSAKAWGQLEKIYKEAMAASRQGQKDRFALLVTQMGEVISDGAGQASSRKELKDLVEQERKLVDAQRQLYIDLGEFITRGQALTMMSHILEAIKEHVTPLPGGPQAVQAVAGAIIGLVGEVRSRDPDGFRSTIIEAKSSGVAE